MVEETYAELLQRRLDGVTTPEESIRLRERLATDAELRALEQDFDTLSRMLQSLGDVAPPADLKTDILRVIRARGSSPAAASGGFDAARSAVRRLFRPAPAFGFAAGVVAGALLILALGSRLSWMGMDRASMPGTMLPLEQIKPLDDMQVIETRVLQAQGITGGVEIRRTGDLVLVDIDIAVDIEVESAQQLVIVLELDAETLRPLGFEQSDGFAKNISLSAERLRIEHTGSTRYRFLLKQAGVAPSAPLRLEFSTSSGSVLLQESLRTSSAESRPGAQ